MNLLGLSDLGPGSIDQYLLPYELRRRVFTVRKHPAVLLGPLIFSLTGFIGAGLLTAGVIHGSAVVLSAAWAACAALLLYFSIRMTAWASTYFVATGSRVFLLTGLFVRTMTVIPLREITDMSLRRSKLGRFFGYGTFTLELAEKEQLREFSYLPYPEYLFLDLSDIIFPAHEVEDTQET
jgi:membrane protein YdbS with pleckstrin-like domain